MNTARRQTETQSKETGMENTCENTRHYTDSPTRNIANKFDVPISHILPVHPVEHWHMLGETQDPCLHPWEQIAVK